MHTDNEKEYLSIKNIVSFGIILEFIAIFLYLFLLNKYYNVDEKYLISSVSTFLLLEIYLALMLLVTIPSYLNYCRYGVRGVLKPEFLRVKDIRCISCVKGRVEQEEIDYLYDFYCLDCGTLFRYKDIRGQL